MSGLLQVHRLLLPPDTAPQTVFALARDWFQLTQDASDGSLRLLGELTLIQGEVPQGAPEWVASCVELHSPAHRSSPVPPEIQKVGGLYAIFGDGEPVGAEREGLEFLMAAARYCAGALLTRKAYLPRGLDGDDRIVFAPIWLTPRALAAVVHDVVGVVQLRSHIGSESTDFYSLVSTTLYGSFTFDVAGAHSMPLSVHRHPWAQSGAVCYEIRHHGDDPGAAHIISACARLIARNTEGIVTNDDGFDVSNRMW